MIGMYFAKLVHVSRLRPLRLVHFATVRYNQMRCVFCNLLQVPDRLPVEGAEGAGLQELWSFWGN